MTGSRAPEVLVVGGGAVGLAAALELARRGVRPVVVERSPDLVSGCSSGSAGLLSPGHSVPLANLGALREGLLYMFRRDSPFSLRPRPALVPWLVRFIRACSPERVRRGTEVIRTLSVASLRMHAELAREGLDTGFTRRGAVNVYTTERAFEAGRREAAHQAERGIKSEVLDPLEARELEPALADGLAGAVYYPEEAHCIPRSFMVAVASAAAEAGATIRTGVEVRRLDLRDGRVASVDTTDGLLYPGTVVLSNGAWASRLARQLGVALPVEGGKGYHLDLSGDGADPRIPVYMQEFRVIATPMGEVLRLAGTLQLTGLSTRIDRVRVRAILEAGTRVLRGVGGERVVEVWGGIRPCPPDGLPIIGRSRRVDNVIFATGHAMKGLHLAPVTGKLVADLLEGKEPSFDLAPLSPDRFVRDRQKHTNI